MIIIKIAYVNGSVKSNKNRIGSLSDIGSHSVNLFEFFINKKFKVISNIMQKNEYFKDDNGFITLKRRKKAKNLFNEELFSKIVKLSFQQRRKILRNSLKKFELDKKTLEDSIFDKRPERLSFDEFINLTKIIQDAKI